eukprot:1158713-Pelagomonas_calceolata.AAC.2
MERMILDEIGTGGFGTEDFEILQQLGRIETQEVSHNASVTVKWRRVGWPLPVSFSPSLGNSFPLLHSWDGLETISRGGLAIEKAPPSIFPLSS